MAISMKDHRYTNILLMLLIFVSFANGAILELLNRHFADEYAFADGATWEHFFLRIIIYAVLLIPIYFLNKRLATWESKPYLIRLNTICGYIFWIVPALLLLWLFYCFITG